MKKRFLNKKVQLIFFVLGAVSGFLYWKYIGCISGTCPIKSVWYWSMLWGAVIGYLVGGIVHDVFFKQKSKPKDEG